MQFYCVNKNCLKIYLTREDLENHDMEYEDFEEHNEQTKHFLLFLLALGKEATGFDASHGRVQAEVYENDSLEEGELTVIFRVLGALYADTSFSQNLPGMYAFFSFEEVLDACRNWLKSPGHRETPSSLYRWEDVYFLIVKKPPKALCALLQEYGEDVENTTADLAFINEHGQKLLEGNALSCLGRL